MKSPIDVVKGRIVDIKPDGEITIKAKYDNIDMMLKREYKECNVQLIDSRQLSGQQRKACYALLKEISEYTGMGLDPTKEYMKLKFLSEDLNETADKIFSLSNASMSLVCAFQRFLIKFMLDWDIPSALPLMLMVDDVNDYVYSCLASKHCCICGKKSDLHHVDRVGMGRNRNDIIHEGMRVLPLCREHHTMAHTMSISEFKERYHLPDGIVLDKHLCKIYGLKRKSDGQGISEQAD